MGQFKNNLEKKINDLCILKHFVGFLSIIVHSVSNQQLKFPNRVTWILIYYFMLKKGRFFQKEVDSSLSKLTNKTNNRNMDKQLISLMLKWNIGAKCFLKVEFEFLLHLLFDEVVSKSVFGTLRLHCLSRYLMKSNLKSNLECDFKKGFCLHC